MQPNHRRADLINTPPPHDIIHLFRHSPTDGDALLASIRRDNNMALAILDDAQTQLETIEHDLTTRFQAMRNNLDRYRLQAIASQNSLTPTERRSTAAILGEVENIDDVDHV